MPIQPEESTYHLAPAVGARLVGALLVLLALLLAVATVVVAVADLSVAVLIALAAGGAVAVLAVHLLTRRVPVVRFGPTGYRVRLLRGTGVAAAAWTDVVEAITSTPGGVPVVVLRLREDRSTTIPVTALEGDREEFVRDLQAHLQHGQGLRPLS